MVTRAVALVAATLPLAMAADEPGSTVEKCSKVFGTLAVAEPQTGLGHLQQYGLGSPAMLLRSMIQRSGCFDVVERGVAMQNLQQERALMNSGDLRADSNVGQGQMQAADFVLSPTVPIGAQTTGGIGAGLLGRLGGLAGALAAGLKFKEASTSIAIADVRSSIQVSAAEGKASRTDFSVGGCGLGAIAGGYTSTPEGKVVAASFLDNYNKIVVEIRDKAKLIRPSSAAADANAAASTRAEAPMKPGQMLSAKIGNVKVYADPAREANVVGTRQRGDEMVATGESKNGFAMVDTANFAGWVQRTLVAPVAGAAASPVAAAAPMPALTAALLPLPPGRYRYGRFSGIVEGADTGSFRVMIADDGSLTGDGRFTRLGAVGLFGQYEADKGQLFMQGSSGGGNMIFIGRYDPERGTIVGTWNLGGLLAGLLPGSGGGGGGSFSGTRQ